MKINYEQFIITDEETTIQKVYELLANENSVANISLNSVKKAISNSLSVSIYDGLELVGFARVVTDYSSLSVVLDMVIDPSYRSQGLGREMCNFINNHPKLKPTTKVLWTKGGEKFFGSIGYHTIDRTLMIRQ